MNKLYFTSYKYMQRLLRNIAIITLLLTPLPSLADALTIDTSYTAPSKSSDSCLFNCEGSCNIAKRPIDDYAEHKNISQPLIISTSSVGSITGTIDFNGDKDSFNFTLHTPQTLILYTNYTIKLTITLTDNRGNIIIDNYNFDNNDEITLNLDSGTYFLTLSSNESRTHLIETNYILYNKLLNNDNITSTLPTTYKQHSCLFNCIDNSCAINTINNKLNTNVVSNDTHSNTIKNATVLDGNNNTTQTSIDYIGDIDTFKFNIYQDSKVVFYTTGSVNTIGAILDATGKILHTNDEHYNATPPNFYVEEYLTQGEYYLQIKAKYSNNATGDYTLHHSITNNNLNYGCLFMCSSGDCDNKASDILGSITTINTIINSEDPIDKELYHKSLIEFSTTPNHTAIIREEESELSCLFMCSGDCKNKQITTQNVYNSEVKIVTIDTPTDTDIFKLELISKKVVNISTKADINTTITLFDNNNTQLAISDLTQNNINQLTQILDAGVYYIKITAKQQGRYELVVNKADIDENEYFDTKFNTLNFYNDDSIMIANSINYIHDSDTHPIWLSIPGRIKITANFLNYSNQLDCALYDSNNKFIASNDNTNPKGCHIITPNLEIGEYYFKTEVQDNNFSNFIFLHDYNTYRIHIKRLPPNNHIVFEGFNDNSCLFASCGNGVCGKDINDFIHYDNLVQQYYTELANKALEELHTLIAEYNNRIWSIRDLNNSVDWYELQFNQSFNFNINNAKDDYEYLIKTIEQYNKKQQQLDNAQEIINQKHTLDYNNYDLQQQITQKQKQITALTQKQQSQTPTQTHYIYHNNNLIGEYNSINDTTNNTPTQTTTPLQETLYLYDTPIITMQNNQNYCIYPDEQNTPRQITDKDNNLVWSWDNTNFGINLAQLHNGYTDYHSMNNTNTSTTTNTANTNKPFVFNLRYPGQYYDNESGLHYNINRYYNPKTGRYLTPDPLGLRGGVNLYSYVEHNPINYIDPLGLRRKGGFQSSINWKNKTRLEKTAELLDMKICEIWPAKCMEDIMKDIYIKNNQPIHTIQELKQGYYYNNNICRPLNFDKRKWRKQ